MVLKQDLDKETKNSHEMQEKHNSHERKSIHCMFYTTPVLPYEPSNRLGNGPHHISLSRSSSEKTSNSKLHQAVWSRGSKHAGSQSVRQALHTLQGRMRAAFSSHTFGKMWRTGQQELKHQAGQATTLQQKYMRQERHTLPAPGRAASLDNGSNQHLELPEDRNSNCTHGHGGTPVLSVICAHMGSQNLYSQNINRKL